MLKSHQLPGRPRRDLYHESFEQFDGNPEAFADNFFSNAKGEDTSDATAHTAASDTPLFLKVMLFPLISLSWFLVKHP